MKVAQSTVQLLTITEAPRLDAVRVILQDEAHGAGNITITCFGQAWTAFWSGMSGRTMAQFFVDGHPDYLLGKLLHGKQTKAHEAYTLRVIEAVQQALAGSLLQAGVTDHDKAASFNHDSTWRAAIGGK